MPAYGGYTRLSASAEYKASTSTGQSSDEGTGSTNLEAGQAKLERQRKLAKSRFESAQNQKAWEEEMDAKTMGSDADEEIDTAISDALGSFGPDIEDYDEGDLEKLGLINRWRTFTTEFRRHIVLAIRLAIVTAGVSVPAAAPWLIGDRIPSSWIAQSGTVIWCLVIVTKTSVGETIEAIVQSMVGMMIAIICGLLLAHCCTDGVWQISISSFFFFALFILYFDFSHQIRVVSLVFTSYFCMVFGDPHTKLDPIVRFERGSMLTAIVVSLLLSYCVSLAVMFFPPAFLARDMAKKSAATTAKSCAELFVLASKYYCGKTASVSIHKWLAKMKIMMHDVDLMFTQVKAAWWEGFDFGECGKIRALEQRHLQLLKDALERLYAVEVCASQESFSEDHHKALKPVKRKITGTARESGELLMLATISALDGSISEQEQQELERRRTELQDRAHELSEHWHRHRLESELFKADMLNESFFVYEVCAFARIVSEYTVDLINAVSNPTAPLSVVGGCWSCLKKPFKVRCSSTHLGFVFRNLLVLTLCFVLGFNNGYDPLMAKNAAVMLSKERGSAMTRNLSRVQGTVLGIVFGNLLYLKLYYCEPQFYALLRCVVTFAYECFAYYLMYSSAEYGFVGSLLALFGGQELVQTCQTVVDKDELGALQAGAYHKIEMAMMAVCIYQLTDFVFLSTPASVQARDKFIAAMEGTVEALGELIAWEKDDGEALGRRRSQRFETLTKLSMVTERRTSKTQRLSGISKTPIVVPSDAVNGDVGTPRESLRSHSTELQETFTLSDRVAVATIAMDEAHAALDIASSINEEAAKEPRYHKCKWPTELFTSQCNNLNNALLDLKAVQHAMEGSDRVPDDLFCWLEEFDAYKQVWRDTKVTLQDAIRVTRLVLAHESHLPLHQELINNLKVAQNVLKLDGIEKLLRQLNDELEGADLQGHQIKTSDTPDADWLTWRRKLIDSHILPASLCQCAEASISVESRSQTMEDDEVCRLKVILVMLESFVNHVGHILTASIEHVAS